MATQKLYAGVKLRETRGRLGLTQKAFAEKLGVSLPYLNQMENNYIFDGNQMVSLSCEPGILTIIALRFSNSLALTTGNFFTTLGHFVIAILSALPRAIAESALKALLIKQKEK